MGKAIQIRVDKSLQQALEELRKKVAGEIKSTYGLTEIKIHGTLASAIAAAKLQGRKNLNFRIKRSGLNKGCLEIIG